MNKELDDLQKEFDRASSLLRVRAFVKHLKNENLEEEVLKLIATTFTTIARAKEVADDINQLRSRRRLTADQHHQLYLFEAIMKDLLKEIRTAIENLDSETNLMRRECALLSVIKDLDDATGIFNEIVALGQSFRVL